jgi:hypothetical protein
MARSKFQRTIDGRRAVSCTTISALFLFRMLGIIAVGAAFHGKTKRLAKPFGDWVRGAFLCSASRLVVGPFQQAAGADLIDREELELIILRPT